MKKFCLFLALALLIVSLNGCSLGQFVNGTNEVIVYVDDSATDAEARALGSQILRIASVEEVAFVSREQALEELLSAHEDPEAFAGIDAEDLQHRYLVTITDRRSVDKAVAQLEALELVAEVKVVEYRFYAQFFE